MSRCARGTPIELVESVPELAASGPIDEVHLSTASDDDATDGEPVTEPGLAKLIRLPHLRGVRVLRLGDDGYLSPTNLVRLLTEAAWRDSLEVLDMGPDYCDTEVMQALAAAPMPSTLVELRAQGWMVGMGDDGLRALAQSSWLPRLQRLDLGAQGLTDEGARHLASATGLSLRSLDLHGGAYTGNAIGADGIAALAEASWFPDLEFLGLAMCGDPGDAGVRRVMARGTSLERVNLSTIGLTWEFLQVAPHLSAWSNLKMLSLAGNAIGDDGAEMLAQAGTLPQTLILRSCGIGPTGLRFLSAASPVDELDLRQNRVTRAEWMQALETDTLPKTRSLWVDGEDWPDETVRAFESHYPEFIRGNRR